MITYTVKYRDVSGTMQIEAESFSDAYIKFLEDAVLHQSPIIVSYESVIGGGVQSKTFSDHMDASSEIANEEISAIADTQQEMLSVLKHIRLIMCGFIIWIIVHYWLEWS